jgi:cytochrome c oxidase cbb3-type subunit 4
MSGTVSGIITVVLLVLFIAGWMWAWSSKRKPDFDAAARLPLEEHDAPPAEVREKRAGRDNEETS